MKAIVIHETGGTEVLRYEDVDRPEPGEGEVLIAVRAASVNPIDWKQRGSMEPDELPAILGRDVSGVVEVSRADGFSEGDEVFGWTASGGYAEYATGPAAGVARKPPEGSVQAAAASSPARITAWAALLRNARVPSRPP